jgi:hypothetical protein
MGEVALELETFPVLGVRLSANATGRGVHTLADGVAGAVRAIAVARRELA